MERVYVIPDQIGNPGFFVAAYGGLIQAKN